MRDIYRIGIGYDAHRSSSSRPLVLGGVTITADFGLEGWSDADVLVHAVADACLGAAAAGDIGTHFPPGDLQYKEVSSLRLLERVREIIAQRGFEVVNIDTVLIMESPKISEYRDAMAANISSALGIERSVVGVKATTTEGLGFTGRAEGAAAQAVALLKKREPCLPAGRREP